MLFAAKADGGEVLQALYQWRRLLWVIRKKASIKMACELSHRTQ
jgi:hypothetical protein